MISSPAPNGSSGGGTVQSVLLALAPQIRIFFCFASACACALDKLLTSSINVSCCAERAREECAAALHTKCGAVLGRKKGIMPSERAKNYESGRKKSHALHCMGGEGKRFANCKKQQMKRGGLGDIQHIRLTDQTRWVGPRATTPPYVSSDQTITMTTIDDETKTTMMR